VPWYRALVRVGLPLAAAFLAVISSTLRLRMASVEWPGFFWTVATGGAALAVAGFALRRRGLAVVGALGVLLACVVETRNGAYTEANVYYWYAPTFARGAGSSLLGSSLVGGLVLLWAAVRLDRTPRRDAVAIAAWTGVVCCAALFVPREFTPGAIGFDQGGLFAIAFTLGAAILSVRHGRVVAALAVLIIAPQGLGVAIAMTPAAGNVPLQLVGWAAIPLTAWLLARGAADPSVAAQRVVRERDEARLQR
jgi:hypothetical protein